MSPSNEEPNTKGHQSTFSVGSKTKMLVIPRWVKTKLLLSNPHRQLSPWESIAWSRGRPDGKGVDRNSVGSFPKKTLAPQAALSPAAVASDLRLLRIQVLRILPPEADIILVQVRIIEDEELRTAQLGAGKGALTVHAQLLARLFGNLHHI